MLMKTVDKKKNKEINNLAITQTYLTIKDVF